MRRLTDCAPHIVGVANERLARATHRRTKPDVRIRVNETFYLEAFGQIWRWIYASEEESDEEA